MYHFVVAATRGSVQQRSKAHLSVLSLPDVRLASGQPVPHLSNWIRELTRIFGGVDNQVDKEQRRNDEGKTNR